MTSLLIIIVLVLLAIALWQLTRIFDLTQVGKASEEKTEVANDKDNNTQGYIMFAFFGIHLHIYYLRLVKVGSVNIRNPCF